MIRKLRTLGAVHTHTHTHTWSLYKKEKYLVKNKGHPLLM